ncbi:laminin subunit alpha-3 [Erinaceus europaeus]|uniref:Laminin subunit alpha-3 n=1 Tax=Erinaceus europaeus TaxID=9365 RepID=A0ABM3W0G6_ERIEU|nr:laminin subunit alpha-3 [Erinaceus europaeus]
MAMARRVPGGTPQPMLRLLWLLWLPDAFPAASAPALAVARASLLPPYFNLAEAAKIWATATCGERERPRPELYCKLVGGPTAPGSGHTIQGQFCDYCNSEDPKKAHPATNAIDGSERWWQSPPLSSGMWYNQVNVTLDLGQLFHVAYVLIKFANSPRPDLWVLERSVDFGITYSPWQYFAHSKLDCWEQFGQEANMAITRDDDVLCTTEYSRIVPLENGEVVVSLINGRPGAKNFTFSRTLRDFTRATNIRLRFLRTNTLLGHLISKAQRDPTVTRRYFYSIKDISIGGRCVCNGHAEVCNANNPEKLFRCECQHHTCGETCDRCCVGYNQRHWLPATRELSNECEACNCHGHAMDCYYDPDVERQQASLNAQGIYAGGGVCINCQHNTAGVNCEKCAKGYYRPHGVPVEAPHGCTPCSCNPEHADDCEQGSGRCHCKLNFQGDHCEKCAVGYHHFPLCSRIPIFPTYTPSAEDPVAGDIKGCDCNLSGVLPQICDDQGRCLCRPGVEGPHCDTCHSDFYSFPICQACQCSPLGSYQTPCNPVTGQCKCFSGITGKQCDRCLSGAYDFPYCQDASSACDPAGTLDSSLGYCQCKLRVESPTCHVCKPLYWNLANTNPNGCIECQCHVAGTVSGLGECGQQDGDCHCKSHVTGDSCDTCEDGYFALEKDNYFGCQGCQCDVGGAISPMCSRPSGACQCREHVVGKTCQRPEDNYYFPNLHHMKYEIEDGTVPSGRELRFGFDPREFPEFSWRGYAQMTSVQNEVRIMLNVRESSLSLFRVILKYVNPDTKEVYGHVTIYPSSDNAGAAQSKEVIFLPNKEPAFVTIRGNGFADPFSLTPGTWIACIKAEGVLLDYLVLLPRDYYEAPSLQLPVTEPCVDTGSHGENCLLYQHLPVTGFSCTLACEARHVLIDGEPRPLTVRQPTPAHPVMVDLSGREVELHLQLWAPQVGRYVVMVEYVSEAEKLSVVDVDVESPDSVVAGQVDVYSCKYSVLCRSLVTDGQSRKAVFELLGDANIRLKVHMARFLLHQICIIPIEEFSTEYLRPQVKCIAIHGQFVNQSATCVSLAPETPARALTFSVPSSGDSPPLRQGPSPSAGVVSGITLKAPQNQVTLRGLIPHPGRYVFVIHFSQPAHPMFPTQVLVDGGHLSPGSFHASFCPHVLGCQDQVVTEDQVEFDISKPEVSVTVKVPEEKSLVLVRVLVVPAENHDYQILHKKSVDKSLEFISSCGGDSFYIDPQMASQFCKNSARSLVAFYYKGALPCECHPTGTLEHHCSPEGGQCPCRANIIGRQCTRCQTGYYGFPHCKPCNCGRHLCEEVTGTCICPPRTVRPRCETCESHAFSFHPLAGCEGCNCSRKGTVGAVTPECDRDHGQCRCKPRITGQQCDRCAPGFYRFPECIPCHCNRDGTELGVCDPGTGACLCKENVEGRECSVCRPGSFHLDRANPKGCTSCFCFGVSTRCHSTQKRRAKFVDMMGWHLEAAHGAHIPVSFNPGSSSVVADLQELPSTVHSVSWVAPLPYLGDKRYGVEFSFPKFYSIETNVCLEFDSSFLFYLHLRSSDSPQVLDLVNKSTKRDVSLGDCSLNKPPFLMLLKGSTKFSKAKTFNINQPLQDTPVASLRTMEVWQDHQSCLPPIQAQPRRGALRFGDSPTSHVQFKLPQVLLQHRVGFTVDIQTVSSRGLVFYAGTKSSYMALYLSNGRLVFTLGAGGEKLRLKSKEKYNDGRWHKVAFGQDGGKGHLVVDGLRAREGSFPGNSTISLTALVYLGSAPSRKSRSLPPNSFVGCLRNFQFDLKSLETPSASFGVSPCLGGSLEKGIYFTQDGGHITIAKSVLLGPEFRLVFSIRPRSLTGILIYIGSQPGKHLGVYLEAGKVTASVNSEAGGISTSVTPKQSLCDGQWHLVSVTIKQYILHLELDADNSYTAGQLPFPPTSTQEPLYVGGVPATLKTLKLPVWKPFFGCLKNIQVNHIPIPVTEAGEVQGTVSLNGCPDH